jgi:hypothetical protein
VYGNSKITLSTLPVSTTYNFPEASTYTSDVYSATGDKLCWGSSNEGLVIYFFYLSFKLI